MVRHAVALVAWALSSRGETAKYRFAGCDPAGTQRYRTLAFCSARAVPDDGHRAAQASFRQQSRRRRKLPRNEHEGVGPDSDASTSAGIGEPQGGPARHPQQRTKLKTLNKRLHRHAKRGEAKDAEALLERMHALYSAGELTEPPDIISYGSVMDALTRCKDKDAAERAEALSTRLITFAELGGTTKPNLRFFNALLNCYAERGNADEAEALLGQMHELHSGGNLEGGPPDAVSYATVIKALGNNNSIKRWVAVERAEAILERFENEEDARLNCQTCVSLLRLYAKWGLGDEAEKLLKRMHDMDESGHLDDGPPNIIAYTAALNAWVKSKDRDATDRAKALFHRMEEDSERSKSLHPDVIAFNTLLRCYAVRGMAHEAELLLMKMEKLYTTGKLGSSEGRKGRGGNRRRSSDGPDRISYTTVLTALAKSDDADAPGRAVDLLDQMRQLHAEGRRNMMPDVVTHACVVRCVLRGQDHLSVSPFEQAVLLKELQIEEWPFRDQELFPWN